MKKTLIAIVAVCLLLVGAVSAQDAPKKFAGIKGVVGIANITGDIENNKSMVTFGGGAVLQVKTSDQLTIQPEFQIMMKGTEEDVTDGEKYKLTYLEIPVLFKFNPATSGNMKPTVFAGPALGLLMSAKIGDEDIKDYLKSTDFGVVFGAGLNFDSGPKSMISVDARYSLGLSNINDDVDADEFSLKNSVISLNIAYLFGLGN